MTESQSVETSIERLLSRATQALAAGRADDAVAPLSRAAELRPSDAAIHHDLGLALLEAGQAAAAVAALRHCVGIDPAYADAWFRLGLALEKLGEANAAVSAYDQATGLKPAWPEAWFRAGALVHSMGHRDEAIGCFRRAAETGAKTTFGRLGAARALLTQERDDDAERVLRKALAVDPGNALAHDLLGNLLAEWGRFDEAQSCFTQAVTLAPLLAGSYYDLVRCRPMTHEDDGLRARMEAALASPALDAGQRQRVHLALGKLADDLGDPARAMRHFDAADRLRPGSAAFDAAAFDIEVGRIIERCTRSRLAHGIEGSSPDATPILIVGMPRSGTTLVEQILSCHPDVQAGGELNFWNERGALWHAALSTEDDPAFVRRAAADYLRILREGGRKSARVTDKMPFNFLWAGLVRRVFPHAVIVHCRRAAIDTALSIHQTLFHPDLAFPTGGANLVSYFCSYRRLSEHWHEAMPPDRYIELDYETLTREPEPEIRRLVQACNLKWNDDCLRPHLNTRAVRTPSKWQTRQPINRQSVHRWRRYETCLGPLRELLEPDA